MTAAAAHGRSARQLSVRRVMAHAGASGTAISPRAGPERHGEPSRLQARAVHHQGEPHVRSGVWRHARGEGDARLCIYGREVTPNHHSWPKTSSCSTTSTAAACSGPTVIYGPTKLMSPTTSKSFWRLPAQLSLRRRRRAGRMPLSGFLWDAALARKRRLRVYGEFVQAADPLAGPGAEAARLPRLLPRFRRHSAIDIRGTATIKTLEPYLCPTFIGFPSTVPDVYRAGSSSRN